MGFTHEKKKCHKRGGNSFTHVQKVYIRLFWKFQNTDLRTDFLRKLSYSCSTLEVEDYQQERFRINRECCFTNQKDSLFSPQVDLADFFIYLHEERSCQPDTITDYRSAITSIHKGWKNSSVSSNPDYQNLLKESMILNQMSDHYFQIGIYHQFYGNCVIILLNPWTRVIWSFLRRQ
jgi:hypothetical protein